MATVLMVMTLASILAFTLAATGLFHLNVCARTDNAMQAQNYAESGISRCLEKVMADVYYGGARNETIEIEEHNTIVGELSFDPVRAQRRDIPFSTNNIMNSASIYGCDNRLVPANSIHIISKGSCNGVIKNMEAVIHVPSFPFCIATSGKFRSEGTLLVGSVDSLDDIKNGVDEGRLQPGNVVSNSTEQDAVLLNGTGTIMGDLRTSGNVKIEKGSAINIKGEIRRQAAPVAILPIDILSYDPVSMDGVQHLPSFLENPRIEGYCRIKNGLTVSGDMELSGSLLYVEGDLNITGGVKGKGAVVVTGKTRIDKGADLSSDNLVALLSRGDVSLGGNGSTEYSAFQGIVYTEGSFAARNISVYGSFIDNGTASSTVKLSDARVIQVSSQSKVEVEGPPSETISFHYAGKSSLPIFKLTVTKGRSGMSYTLANTADNTKKIFNSRSDMVDSLIKWWSYCEDNCLYGADRKAHIQDNEWDYDDVPGTIYHEYESDMTYGKVSKRINKYLDGLLDETELTRPSKLFSLNLKEFLGIKDRMRIVLWREI